MIVANNATAASLQARTIMKLAFFLLMLVVGEDLCEHVTVSALSQRHAHTIRIGTRPSPLAKIQARTVSEALQRISSESNHELKIEIVEIGTTGDMSRASASTQNLPLAVKSVDFTGALDQALLSHEIDAAVHSLKDIPPTSRWCDDLKISCCLPREDPMDVLVSTASSNNSMYFSILGLPKGSRIGTSSVRRQAQILSIRNDLELVNLRGNVEHRLDALRSGKIHSLILASAGLNRLMANGNDDAFRDLKWQNLSPDEMLSGACQGIIGVATRTSDTATSEWLRRIDDENASIAAAAERSFLNTLDAFRPSNYLRHNEKDNPSTVWTGRPPLAVLMTKEIEEGQENSKRWILQGMLACPDGSKILRSGLSTPSKIVSINEAKELGKACGKTILEKAGPNFYQE